MQLGISTYTYGWAIGSADKRPPQPLDEITLLRRAAQFGLGVVQFGDNWALHELTDERLDALRQQAISQGIQLEVGARGLTEQHLDQYIRLASQLNSQLLRFVIDTSVYEPNIETVVAILRNALPALVRSGVTLGLENHDRLLVGEFADIMEQVGHEQIGICLDSVNSIGAGEGLAEVVRTLAPYTVNLHLKDFGIQRLPHLMGFQIDGRIAGQGMLNIPWLVEQVAPFCRCQTAILEQWVVPETTLDESIRKEEIWAIESINYLKSTKLFNAINESLTLNRYD